MPALQNDHEQGFPSPGPWSVRRHYKTNTSGIFRAPIEAIVPAPENEPERDLPSPQAGPRPARNCRNQKRSSTSHPFARCIRFKVGERQGRGCPQSADSARTRALRRPHVDNRAPRVRNGPEDHVAPHEAFAMRLRRHSIATLPVLSAFRRKRSDGL